VKNEGQWNPAINYQFEYDNRAIFLLDDGFSFLEIDSQFWKTVVKHPEVSEEKSHKVQPALRMKYNVLKTTFIGSNSNALIQGSSPLNFHNNYFIGHDKSKWKSKVALYQKVTYINFYKNIDLEVIAYEYGMKYNFILHKGADYKKIKWQYQGAESIRVKDNRIVITTSVGKIIERMPEVYIQTETEKIKINGVFTEDKGLFSYALNLPAYQGDLIIDPELIFSTYAGNTVDNFGFTATYDQTEHLYSGGIATGPTLFINGRYPASPGAFDETYNGGNDESENGRFSYFFHCDISLSKYSSDGKTLLYATYLGGSSNEYPHSIVVNLKDELIVMGTSFSANFPTNGVSYQPIIAGKNDIIVTKFNSDCSGILGSTYFGGSESDGLNQASILKYFYADDFRGEVQVDSNDNIYIVSSTFSTDLPLKNSFIQNTNKGGQDGLFVKFNSQLSDVIWSNYFGGVGDDAAYNFDFDSRGNMFISGGTKSNNLAGTAGAIHWFYKGGTCDGFITSINADATSINRTTYWGSDKYDQIFGIEIDKEDKIYVVGQTHGNMPISGSVYNVPNSGQFLTKFSNSLIGMEWSTLWGTGDGAPDITINAFLVDECQKIFVSGWGGGSSTKSFSSTQNLPITSDAVQKTTDGSDFYLAVFSKDAKRLVYGTYFGGYRTHDHVDGGTSRFDKKGVIYQSVCASCPESAMESKISDFPTTKGSYAEKNISPRCSNAAFKIAFGNLNRAPEPKDTFFEVTALDTIDFSYFATDPDEDSLFVEYLADKDLANHLLYFKNKDLGLKWVHSFFTLVADCKNSNGDTLRINVYARDKGCPDYKDSFAVISIKINPPPAVPPPATICLNFNQDHLKLGWEPSLKSHYFDYILLYKVSPNGITTIIDTVYHQNTGDYSDYDVINPKFNNYTYYLVAQNRCGLKGDTSIIVSSTKEYEIPIEVAYVVTATVTDDENVKLIWTSSTEADFGSYDIYRKTNFEKTDFEYVTTVSGRMDTSWIDKKVKVHEYSYCYAIIVNDNCGHISKLSNKGCTIVLKGDERPFYFNLYWNAYEQWQDGVLEYTLQRSVDTGSLRPIVVNTANTFFYKDDNLDYDWGGYWYKIRAKENFGVHEAISNSNKIYLIQPPLLHVPNAFTPNDDQLNEKWGIVPVFVKEYQLRIYNRWGEKVYETNDKHNIWSGEYKNELTTNNVYIYQIMFTGWDRSVHYRKGTVTVLK
jgi:gliding motility-associated-like protein